MKRGSRAAFAGVFVSLVGMIVGPALAGVEPPNVILIMTDDQGYADLGCFGAQGFETPAIDGMAQQGLRLTSYYSGSAVCSPTRASLMTGSYASRVGCATGVFWPNSTDGLSGDEVTIAELLKKQGYATACIGKWHLGHLEPFRPTSQGFDSYFGVPYSNDMGRLDPVGNVVENRPPRFRGDGVELWRDADAIEESPDQSVLTKRYTEEAVRFIVANADRPFFLYLAHSMPHLPLFASEEFEGRTDHGLYGDVIEEIDWSVGQILAALDRHGLSRRTLVVFTSDNGPHQYRDGRNAGSAWPLRSGKGTTWEGGQRVPCVVRWPTVVPPGAVSDEVASSIDWLPTIAAAAGAELPSDRVIDGRDLRPLLEDPGANHLDYPFYFVSGRGSGERGSIEAIRLGRWKLHVRKHDGWDSWDREAHGEFRPALYDLDADIGETTNLIDRHPELAVMLKALIRDAHTDFRLNGRPRGKSPARRSSP
ncbi:MAG: sulfatase [Planctomycetota bacterium]